MGHEPLTQLEIDMYIRRARETRAASINEFGRGVSRAVRRSFARLASWMKPFAPRDRDAATDTRRVIVIKAKRHLVVAVTAMAALVLLSGFYALPAAPQSQGFAGICAEREIAVIEAIESRAGIRDDRDVLGLARQTMQTAHQRCSEGKVSQAVALYNYILRRVTTLPAQRATVQRQAAGQ